MSHHAGGPFEGMDEDQLKNFMKNGFQTQSAMDDLTQKKVPPGELQKQIADPFPDGKIATNDEGAIHFKVGTIDGRVILDFGKQIQTIGFTKAETISLCKLMLRRVGIEINIDVIP